MLEFGPDGYLYISVGDGGSSGDPHNNAQNFKFLCKLYFTPRIRTLHNIFVKQHIRTHYILAQFCLLWCSHNIHKISNKYHPLYSSQSPWNSFESLWDYCLCNLSLTNLRWSQWLFFDEYILVITTSKKVVEKTNFY